MPRSDLAHEAAELLSIADTSEPRSLNQLVALATRQVTACSGASATRWHDGQPTVRAASHPDLPELLDVQLRSGHGPVLDALAGVGPVSCPDALTEGRWPEYASAALRMGVRCSANLAYLSDGDAVTLSLFGARPRSLESGQLRLVELLTAFGGALIRNADEYGDARRTALQLSAAAEARALVDQAKGMLMQALGCSAEDALAKMRQISQERNLRVTDVASTIIESRGVIPGQPGRAGAKTSRDGAKTGRYSARTSRTGAKAPGRA